MKSIDSYRQMILSFAEEDEEGVDAVSATSPTKDDDCSPRSDDSLSSAPAAHPSSPAPH